VLRRDRGDDGEPKDPPGGGVEVTARRTHNGHRSSASGSFVVSISAFGGIGAPHLVRRSSMNVGEKRSSPRRSGITTSPSRVRITNGRRDAAAVRCQGPT
jgi:hypothetical protein